MAVRARLIPGEAQPAGETLVQPWLLQLYGDKIDLDTFTVTFQAGDSVSTMRTRILDTARARATALGVTLANNTITFPAIDKG